jgi:hypothetical protein
MANIERLGIWSDELQCFWITWQSTPDPETIMLSLPPDNCCDMNGAIKLAKSLIPKVKNIMVWEGDEVGTCYLNIEGKWEARDARAIRKKCC